MLPLLECRGSCSSFVLPVPSALYCPFGQLWAAFGLCWREWPSVRRCRDCAPSPIRACSPLSVWSRCLHDGFMKTSGPVSLLDLVRVSCRSARGQQQQLVAAAAPCAWGSAYTSVWQTQQRLNEPSVWLLVVDWWDSSSVFYGCKCCCRCWTLRRPLLLLAVLH